MTSDSSMHRSFRRKRTRRSARGEGKSKSRSLGHPSKVEEKSSGGYEETDAWFYRMVKSLQWPLSPSANALLTLTSDLIK